MRCPRCHEFPTSVVDSRTGGDNVRVRRRRRCEACLHTWTTVEYEVEVIGTGVAANYKIKGSDQANSIDAIRAAINHVLDGHSKLKSELARLTAAKEKAEPEGPA